MPKFFAFLCGLLAILALVNGLIVLFTHPFLDATNTKVFYGSFFQGCAFTFFFLLSDKKDK